MKLDILAFGAHPDDIELSAGGTLISHVRAGRKVGLIDLTYGELGTRGNKEIRLAEAEAARKIIGAEIRHNLGFRDGFFTNDEAHQLEIIRMIRKYRPEIVICNAIHDRHPDHGKGASVVADACFYAGLRRIETSEGAAVQEAWRPRAIYHYIQFRDIKPDFLVDISGAIDEKIECVRAHASQFYDPTSTEPQTLIAQPEFLENIKGRAAYYGQFINANYAEGFTAQRYPGVSDLFALQ